MHVLIYEPVFSGGHHLSYVRHLVRALRAWPVRITVVTGQAAEDSESFKIHLRPYVDREEVQASIVTAGPGADWGKHYYEQLVSSVDAVRPDHVFIPTGDIVTAYAGSRRLRGSGSWSPAGAEVDCNVLSAFYPSYVPWKLRPQRLRTSLYASYAPWSRSYTIDPFVSVRGRPWRWIHGAFPEILPDPLDTPLVTSKAQAREALDLPRDEFLVGCVGHFASSDRKNALALVQGFLKSGLEKEGMVALLGPMSKDVLDFVETLDRVRSRVLIRNKLLSGEELQCAVSALDLVCLPYRDFYQPSAIVLNAAALGRPVLASRIGWFQKMIPLFKLGWTAEMSTSTHIAAALREYGRQWEKFSPSVESERLVAFSRWENFSALFCRHLGKRLSMPTTAKEITWDSLLPST